MVNQVLCKFFYKGIWAIPVREGFSLIEKKNFQDESQTRFELFTGQYNTGGLLYLQMLYLQMLYSQQVAPPT